MSYHTLADMVELHKEKIALEVAKKAIARNLPSYVNKSAQELALNFRPTIEMLARYVRHADPTEYRDYMIKLTRTRLSQGYTSQDFYIMGEILTEAIKEVVENYLGEDEKTKTSWFRRLNGIQTLAQTTVVATRLT